MWTEKPPKGTGELILYLDFDGVLHHERCLWKKNGGPYIDAPGKFVIFQHVNLLTEILAPYPQIKIVLSTAWVRSQGCSRTAKRLPTALSERVIGATFHSKIFRADFIAAPRGMQVWGDVVRRNPLGWLAIDDDFLHWPKWCLDNYIRTHEHLGISEPSVEAKLRSSLARICNPEPVFR